MSEHTKEPWGYIREEMKTSGMVIYFNTVQDSERNNLLRFSGTPQGELDCRRIVACVNELAGKPEGYVKQLESANAELVEALEAVHAGLIEHDWPMPHVDWAEDTWEGKLVSALAKHKGGGK